MKIVFIGGVKFSLELFSTLLENKWKIDVVFSYEDSKKKFYSDIANFDEITKKFDITHFKVNNINDPKNIALLKKIKPDLILVMGWSQLLTDEIIKIPKLGVVGSHPTKLPKYRGRAPISWSILKDLNESALTFFYIDAGVDDGDILDQQRFVITKNDDASTIYKKMTELGKSMLLKNLPLIHKNTASRTKQDNSKFLESWPKRVVDDGKINWNDSAKNIDKLIRATTHPYPGAFTIFLGQKLIIWKSKFLENGESKPGVIHNITSNEILIGTGNGILVITNASYNSKINLNKILSKTHIGMRLGV